MNGKSHLLVISGVLIGLWILFGIVFDKPYFTISIVIVAIVITLFPDIDSRFSMLGHRSILTHNIGLWIILFLFNPSFLFILFIVSVGVHCLLDIRFNTRKRVGFYTVKILMRPAIGIFHKDAGNITVWRTVWGMNGAMSTVFLVSNFLCSICILGWWLWLV